MKLRRVAIVGFRGSLPELELLLKGRSLCLLGENGHGKTTIADALELWSTGDLEACHRAGVGLDATVHVDADEARISCTPSGFPPLTRTLQGRTASALVPDGPVPVGELPPRIPMLRHRTMAKFMDRTAGDKLKALLELVGLSELTTFRATVVTVANRLRDDATDDDRKVNGERQALALEIHDAPVLETAERLRVEAGLTSAIDTEEDLLDIEFGHAVPAAQPDRVALVADLARALERLNTASVTRWNALIADVAVTQAGALEALVHAGERALTTWLDDRCPLCLQHKERNRLTGELAARALDLANRTAELRASCEELDAYREQLEAVGRSVAALQAAAPDGGWAASVVVDSAYEAVRSAWRSARDGGRDHGVVVPLDVMPLTVALPSLHKAAAAAGDVAAPMVALASLVRLQTLARRLGVTQAAAAETEARAAAMHAFRSLTDGMIRAVIEELLLAVGQRTADYYGRLVGARVYSRVTLDYRPGLTGGVEFSLVYNNDHEITPPQRVMSESQLNALGLALFLAQLKTHEAQPWRTLVLDDVVNSFDEIRRGALSRLITEEFEDWQVIMLTHDPILHTHSQAILKKGWLHQEIVAWSPTGGITIADAHPLEQLRGRLTAGDAASQLGGIARRALERELSRPVEKLGLKLPYQRDPHHTSSDFLGALRHIAKKSNLALPVLDSIAGSSYFANFAVHDRASQGGISRQELEALVEHLDELAAALRCASCGKPVWYLATPDGRSHQCECSGLALSA